MLHDKLDDRIGALRMANIPDGGLAMSSHRRRKSLMASAFKVANSWFPSGTIVPGAMHQNVNSQERFPQEVLPAVREKRRLSRTLLRAADYYMLPRGNKQVNCTRARAQKKKAEPKLGLFQHSSIKS